MSFRFTTPFHRGLLAACVAGSLLFTSASYGQAGRATSPDAPVSPSGQESNAPIHPESLSCTALKNQLNAAGELPILSGPEGRWGDTFYGPAVPRCQFWQMPVFTYVRAQDGLCGVGYICVEKLTFD